MSVDQFVTKQTWLLDDVEVEGIVRHHELADGAEVGTGDMFGLRPDDNYKHLTSLFPASQQFGIWCETYLLPPDHVNRVEPWPLETKPVDRRLALSNAIEPATGQPGP
jgi:hypothetical protein